MTATLSPHSGAQYYQARDTTSAFMFSDSVTVWLSTRDVGLVLCREVAWILSFRCGLTARCLLVGWDEDPDERRGISWGQLVTLSWALGLVLYWGRLWIVGRCAFVRRCLFVVCAG